jgi:ADP-ribose pyrophosphatase YjhB (NUDIX family)
MPSIYCATPQGTLVAVPETEVIFSPAVYGILIENRRAMLQQEPDSGLWRPPGGILLDGQTPERGVRAFFRTATGFLPELMALLYIEEQYRLDEQDQAWALSIFYYGLQRAVGGTVGLAGVAQDQQPEWVPVQTLSRADMQFGYAAVMAGVRRLGTP